jgi:hypothetical protein
MKRLIRLTLFILAGSTLPVAFVHAFCSWIGEEQWNPRSTGEQFVRESQRRQKLDGDDEIVAYCLARKQQVTADLVAGRLTLAEAARQFHECEAQRDEQLGREVPPLDASRQAAMARTVLRWVASFGQDVSARREKLRVLEKEYRVQFNGATPSELIPG